MAGESYSPNMNLVLPGVGVTPGPQYASNLNASLTILDGHDHAPGSGVQITPAGLDINSELSMQSNDLTQARSVRMAAQSSPIGDATDLGCLYVSDDDLYYNDILGNQIRITQSGGVAGTPGSISNLNSPASASYVGGSQTFVWQSAANTPANMDAASLVIRNVTSGSNGITVSAPGSLASNYSLTLPALPVSQKFMTLDSSGNMAAPWAVDNVTTRISANLLEVITAAILPVGSMLDFAGSSAPSNFLLCDGSAVNRVTYATLFALISTTFGAGDGSTTFNVPDMRGRVPMGSGTGSGLTARTLGQQVGEETHVLSVSEMPVHSHQLFGAGGSPAFLGNNVPALGATDAGGYRTGNINNEGSGAAHNNIQPSLVITKIIKYQ